jgi:hypothetical protein
LPCVLGLLIIVEVQFQVFARREACSAKTRPRIGLEPFVYIAIKFVFARSRLEAAVAELDSIAVDPFECRIWLWLWLRL